MEPFLNMNLTDKYFVPVGADPRHNLQTIALSREQMDQL